jgi:hypothetical protein
MKTATIVRRSFIAMFWGWVACNCTVFSVSLIIEVMNGGIGNHSLYWMIYWLLGSGFVILGAWLVCFLPADLLVKEDSYMRAPAFAGPCGGLAGFMSVWLLFMFTESDDSETPLMISILAAVCGLTASLHLVLHHPRKEQASPQGGVPASLSENPPNDL